MEVRLYDNLFTEPDPAGSDADFLELINHDSLEVVTALVEPSLADANAGDRYQFERLGYFCADSVDSQPGAPGVQPHHHPAGHLGPHQPAGSRGSRANALLRRYGNLKRRPSRRRASRPN